MANATPARRLHRAKVQGLDLRLPQGALAPTIPSTLPAEVTHSQRIGRQVRNANLRLKQRQWCDALVIDSFLLSRSALCRKYQTDHGTCQAVIDAYAEQDRLGDARQWSRKSVHRILELTSDRLKLLLETGKIPAKVLPVLWGIAHDKLALLDAGVLPQTNGKTQVEVDANAASAVLDVFKRLQSLPAVPALPATKEGGGINGSEGVV